MSAPAATFYAIGSDRPTIRAYPPSQVYTWSALSAALASHYGSDAESFHTAEAYWNEGREYAELVTLDGEIVGAVDRPISAADVAAIRGVDLMQKSAFINRIRSLFNIDGYLLRELTSQQQLEFLRDPVRYLLNADEVQSDAIMREVESRQKGEVSDLRSDLSTFAGVNHLAERSLAKELKDKAELRATAKAPKAKKAKPRVEGQREMLLPIAGGNSEGNRPATMPATGRKAG